MSETAVRLLRSLAEGNTLGKSATLFDQAKSTLSELSSGLAAQGLLDKMGNGAWQPTAQGLLLLHDLARGEGIEVRTPARAHGFRLAGDILAMPEPEVLLARLPQGWAVGQMTGWAQFRGTHRLMEMDVPVHINTRNVIAYPPEQWGSPASCALRVLRLSTPLRAFLADLEVDVGSFRFQTPPEYAYPLHPAALAWAGAGRHLGMAPGQDLWVDASKKRLELETNRLSLGLVIERTPFDGNLDRWLDAIRFEADSLDLLDGSGQRRGLAV